MEPVDPNRLLSDIVNTQANDEAACNALSDYLTAHPSMSLILIQSLLYRLPHAGLKLKLFILDSCIRPALTSANVPLDQKSQLSRQSLESISTLVHDPEPKLKKAAIQIFASSYPYLFKEACGSTDASFWEKVTATKNTVLNAWTTSSTGVRVAASKAVQKIIQTQTRGNADPRMQHRVEPNLSMCASHHSFMNPQALEDEAKRLLDECGKTLYISNIPDVLSAIVNCYTGLLKSRPALSNTIFTSLVNWEPSALVSTCTPLQIRSVEKTFRIALAHLLRAGLATAFTPSITEFLHKQNTRMLVAAEESRRKKEEEATRKRNRIAEELHLDPSSLADGPSDGKKRRVGEAPPPAAVQNMAMSSNTATRSFATASKAASGNEPNPLASFDVTNLPVTLVTELIIANLQVVSEAVLAVAINGIRKELPAAGSSVKKEVRIGPVNPIQEEEDELAIGEAEAEAEETIDEADRSLEVFELQAAELSSPALQQNLLVSAVARICVASPDQQQVQNPLWLSLISRLITKGLSGIEAEQETVRQALFDVIKEDWATRLPIAQTWLNEEWMSEPDQTSNEDSPYIRGLTRVLDCLLSPEQKDAELQARQVTQFILDLPFLPSSQIDRLHTLCQHQQHLQLGFTTLRDTVLFRLNNRNAALDALLSLATHVEKVTRNAAILTLKRWVPETAPMADQILAFAERLLEKLDSAMVEVPMDEDDVKSEEGEASSKETVKCAAVKDGQVISGLPPPTTEQAVVQHIELLLALCVKSPELLDRVFLLYPKMLPETQTILQKLITMLIKSMGARHPKILELVRHSPPGAEELGLRVIAILTDKGKTAQPIVNLIKEMASERELNPRYMVAIIPELDKPDIIKGLPKILSIITGSAADKALVRSVIENITVQPHTFGTVSTNIMRVKQSELLTPVEFLILLHQNTKDIGLECSKEVINMCLGMHDVFRPEILAAFMQQIVDEPVLPPLFLRTVIQAATVHKSLQPYVSSNLLSRLITKKIWTTPSLWEGFVRCAKVTAPHSFGTLLQLPKEQLREVMTKLPTLQEPLKDFVNKKFASNKSRLATLLESLGGDQSEANTTGSPLSIPDVM